MYQHFKWWVIYIAMANLCLNAQYIFNRTRKEIRWWLDIESFDFSSDFCSDIPFSVYDVAHQPFFSYSLLNCKFKFRCVLMITSLSQRKSADHYLDSSPCSQIHNYPTLFLKVVCLIFTLTTGTSTHKASLSVKLLPHLALLHCACL